MWRIIPAMTLVVLLLHLRYKKIITNKTTLKHLLKDSENGEIEIPNDAQSTEVTLGFLHRMFSKCLPSNTAIFMFILVTFCLSASDAVSDIALSYFLYTR